MEQRGGSPYFRIVLHALALTLILFPTGCTGDGQLSAQRCNLSHYKLPSSSQTRKPCLKNLELLVPVPIDDGIADEAWREFTGIFLFSLRLFWPLDNTRLVVVAPANRPQPAHQELTRRVQVASRDLAGGRVAFHEAPPGQEEELWPHRHQRIMFHADRYTTAEFVGFCSSGTAFTGVVQEQDLFDEKRRPRIVGLYGRPTHAMWEHVPNITHYALDLVEPFRSMTQFPVVIKTAHLKGIREHIVRHLKARNFDDAFSRIRDAGNPMYSAFSIMTTYLWHKRRGEYSWHVQEFEPGWAGDAPPGQAPNNPQHMATLRPFLNDPLPRIAVNWMYEGLPVRVTKAGWLLPESYFFHLMRDSVCYSMPISAPGSASAWNSNNNNNNTANASPSAAWSRTAMPIHYRPRVPRPGYLVAGNVAGADIGSSHDGRPDMCSQLDQSAIFPWQWVFETHDWSWHPCAPLASWLRRGRMAARDWPVDLMKSLFQFDEKYARKLHGRAGPLAVGHDANRFGPKKGPDDYNGDREAGAGAGVGWGVGGARRGGEREQSPRNQRPSGRRITRGQTVSLKVTVV
eukprot:jgi/Mesvir1/24538/Mv21872-RA.1